MWLVFPICLSRTRGPYLRVDSAARLARYLGYLAEAGGILLNDDRDEANGSRTMPSGLAVDANVTWDKELSHKTNETFWGWKGWLVLYRTHIDQYITSYCMSICYIDI